MTLHSKGCFTMFKNWYRCCFYYIGIGRQPEDVGINLGLLQNGNTITGSTECYTVQKISSFGRGISHDDDGISVSGGVTSEGEEEDLPQKSQNTIKKKGKWSKVIKKTKEPKTPDSFHTLAGVSMMMLQPIASGVGSTSTPDLSIISVKKEFSKKEEKMDYLSPATCKENTGWLKSQSMQDVTSTTDSDSFAMSSVVSTGETTPSTVRSLRFGSVATSMMNVTSKFTSIRSKSSETVANNWRIAVDNLQSSDINACQDQGYGNISFKVAYDQQIKKLFIRVDNLDGLAPKGKDKRPYKTVLKLTLLPQEKTTKTSKTIGAAMSPVVNEDFYLSTKSINNKVLRISVYDHENQGKYDAIGHALLFLDDLTLSNDGAQTLKLYKNSWPKEMNNSNLRITLSYKKEREILRIVVHEAANLILPHEKSRTFVKITHFNKGKKHKEYQSPSVLNTICNPDIIYYEFTADIRMDMNMATNGYLVISLKEKGFLKSNLGRVIFGPLLYTERGYDLSPWGKAILTRDGVSSTFKLYS
ncbi:uncharacterized protein LOC126896374 [Daktulosphaira vitifoliae]|uniref:uncharacterized protein LOC126896374 n=1 Tax=Daktulosphaira vitifoliae TaxID=58002 RepID=UPI0021AA0535|nr:uncharacterized protein LOC126896374 [Daktulosphaira vitifoliae]